MILYTLERVSLVDSGLYPNIERVFSISSFDVSVVFNHVSFRVVWRIQHINQAETSKVLPWEWHLATNIPNFSGLNLMHESGRCRSFFGKSIFFDRSVASIPMHATTVFFPTQKISS